MPGFQSLGLIALRAPRDQALKQSLNVDHQFNSNVQQGQHGILHMISKSNIRILSYKFRPLRSPRWDWVFSHCAVAVMVRWPLLNASRGSVERTGGWQGKLKIQILDVVVTHVKQTLLALASLSPNLTKLCPTVPYRAHFVLKGGREQIGVVQPQEWMMSLVSERHLDFWFRVGAII